MKIAHVVDSMEVGGAETLVAQMCRVHRAQGHEPSIYAIAALGALGQQMQAENIPVHANVGRHLADSFLNFYRIFRNSQPDVVHVHNPTPTIYAAPAARMAGVPSVISTRHSLVAPPLNLKMERKYRIAAKFCDWIVGICDATTNNIKAAGSAPERKIVRVYNGAQPLPHVPLEQRQQKTGFTLLYVGRLEPVKNHPLLLHAFQLALADNSDLQLWIVGDGTERKRLEELTASLNLCSNVKFWGQQLDVAKFFSAADAFVMSSTSEGLPISLLQAFSLGLPAIVTDVGGMAEVVRLAGAGIAVPITEIPQFTSAIINMASNAAERERFSQNARTGFGEHFTLESMVSSYMELYNHTPRARRRSIQ